MARLDEQQEEWRDIKGYEGIYQVSNMGRVKSLPHRHKNRCSYYMTKERILSMRVCGTQREYLAVMLCVDNIHKQFKIHRLVAEAFIPNPNNYKEINHKDENKANNNVENLEWCTRSYNVNYGRGKEKRVLQLREPVLQYSLDGKLIAEYNSFREAAEAVNGSSCNISHCIRGDIKTHKGYIWKRKNAKIYGTKKNKL